MKKKNTAATGPDGPKRASQRPADTSADAQAAQDAIYRRLEGSARVAIVFRLNRLVREAALAGIRRRHPDYDDDQVSLAWRRLVLGDALMREAFPGRALVDP